MLFNGSFRRNFAGAQSSVKLDKSVGLRFGRVLCDSVLYHFFVCEQIENRSVRTETESTEKNSRAKLTLSVDMNPQNTLRVLFEFEPGSAVGDYGRSVHSLTGLVQRRSVIRAGRTNELGNDYSLRAVYDKRTGLGHKREIAHKHGLVDNFVFYFVDQSYGYMQRKRVRRVARPALFLVVLGFFVKPMIEKI